MQRMCFLLATVALWMGLAPTWLLAQEEGPVIGVSDAVAVSVEYTAIIGTAITQLVDIGFACYEIVDASGVVDYGYLPVLEDGSYRAYLTADLQQTIVGYPLLFLYDPLDIGFSGPVQVNFMMSGDSVSATFTRIMATGDAAQIRAFLQLMRETGQLSAQQLAQLEARLLVVQAAEVAAAEIAAAVAAETTAVTATNIRLLVTQLTRAFFLHGRVPALTPSTRLVMQESVRIIRAGIANLRVRLADPRNTGQADAIRRSIAQQEERLAQVINWLTTNGVPIP
jgi:hypothetical protein